MENQRFWLQGWSCYCTEGHRTTRGTNRASTMDLTARGLYNVIPPCCNISLRISKGVTVATAGGFRSGQKYIRHYVFSVSTPAITRDQQSWIIHRHNLKVVSVNIIINGRLKSEHIQHGIMINVLFKIKKERKKGWQHSVIDNKIVLTCSALFVNTFLLVNRNWSANLLCISFRRNQVRRVSFTNSALCWWRRRSGIFIIGVWRHGWLLPQIVHPEWLKDGVPKRQDPVWLWEHTSSNHPSSLEMLFHQMSGVIQGNAAHYQTSLPHFSAVCVSHFN